MSLTLSIASYQRLSPGQAAQYTLDQGRCTIGRAPDNDWVLADPEMVLSKSHCVVGYRDGDYFLTDTSTNGVYVNQAEQRLGRGNSVKLQHGDVLILGDYEIQVSLGHDAGITPGPAPVDDLFGDQTEQLGLRDWDARKSPDSLASADGDPLTESTADPLGLDDEAPPDDWQKHSEFDHLPSEQAFFQAPEAAPETRPEPSAGTADSPPAAGPQQVIPDDWEDSLIFKSAPAAAQSMPSEPAPAKEPAPAEEDPFDFLNEPIDLDRIQVDAPTDSAEPAPAPGAPAAEPDPLDLGDEPKTSPKAVEQAPPEPAPAPPPPAAAQVQPPSTAGRVATGHDGGAMAAFLRGSGLQPGDLPPGVATELLLEQFGKLFRQTAQGMMELLRARSSIKNEFRIERTMVGPVANNPLKVLPTVEEVMKAMLAQRSDIWMTADHAIQEGFEDIRAHELAMIAGMQAALGQLLERFDPVQLEEELGQHSRLADLMAGGRKARYWDAFTRLYSKLAARAEDDFQDLFRKEFAKAYEEQLEKLRS